MNELTVLGTDLKYGKVYVEHGPAGGTREDEPLMILRGQDKLAMGIIGGYQVKAIEAGVDVNITDGLDDVLKEFHRFSVEHPDQLKIPD